MDVLGLEYLVQADGKAAFLRMSSRPVSFAIFPLFSDCFVFQPVNLLQQLLDAVGIWLTVVDGGLVVELVGQLSCCLWDVRNWHTLRHHAKGCLDDKFFLVHSR